MTARLLERLGPEDYLTEYYQPAGTQLGIAAIVLLGGLGITPVISCLNGRQPET